MHQTDRFRALHAEGTFIMPNPWDRGSARILEEMGFVALATTSAGHGRAIGKDDHQVTRDELVQHVGELTATTTLPLNVDSERLYPQAEGGIEKTVRLLAEAGAAGCSIEDYTPRTDAIDPIDVAAVAVGVAAAACRDSGMVLTARAENHLYGIDDLDDTIARLLAYQEAGADVLYAPGLTTADSIRAVIEAVDLPVNVLAMPKGPSVPELAELGVRRVSIGGRLFHAAYRTLRLGAQELLDEGTSTYPTLVQPPGARETD
ncbi:MAG: isocitrate lyase/PEP mutase family protein [Longimicrobiales bacterium]